LLAAVLASPLPEERRGGMHKPADRIRNVALIGHRGSGKTSLHEALLFEAQATNRLGSVLDGTTVSDSEPDEQSRKMSISAALSSFEWSDRKINLLDTPGEPSFVADALSAMRVCESAVFVVNGVMGAEVSTRRLWARAEELDLARMVFVNMLDRERADFFRTLESLKEAFGAHVVATEIPIGSEHDISGIIDLVDMKAYEYEGDGRDNCTEIEIPSELRDLAEEYREKMMDEICEVSDALMERYLEGEEIAHDEIVATLKDGTNHGSLFPVVCGVATRNLGTNRLLDAIVEDLPSPVKHGNLELPEITLKADENEPLYAYVFKTRADPFAGRINLFRVYQGVMRHDTQVMNTRTHGKERIGQLLVFSGKDSGHADEFGPGDIGAVAKLKETRAGDWLAERDEPISMPQVQLPAPVMAFAMEAHGDEDKVFTSLRRLQEEDPTIDLHRDQQTGDQIIAGLSQMHVEVIVDRLKERFGAEVTLKPPRVPYQETIRKPAKAHGRHKKQSGGRGQFGDCHISIEPRRSGDGFEFINQIKGGVIPTSFIPAVEKGVVEAMQSGPIAGCPVKDVSVKVFDGSYHTVDSSEMAFKLAGSIAMREAMANAAPVLLEPIMLVTLSIPEESVGDVIGDLNSRRGRPQGMDSVGGGLTEVKAEVPMAEMLTYAPDLRSLTGGQGDYTMEFLRYEEVPAHLQQKVVEQASEEEAVSA
jgi:elongation factor G